MITPSKNDGGSILLSSEAQRRYFGFAELTPLMQGILLHTVHRKKVVDFGCGGGDLANFMAGSATHVTAIDKALCQSARKTALPNVTLSETRFRDLILNNFDWNKTVGVVSWPASTGMSAKDTSVLTDALSRCDRVVLIGCQTGGTVIGSKPLWRSFLGRRLDIVIRHASGFTALYSHHTLFPRTPEFQEERLGVSGELEKWKP